jgi:hypothetical protein
MFTLLALSMSLNTTTEIRISDNYESQIQASNAALAGINHGRELLRGLRFDDLLVGPDGVADTSTSYLTQARTHGFRSPMAWKTGRALDILNPSSYLGTIADDGTLNTGHLGTTNGTVLIPKTGIRMQAPDPYGEGWITTARYFVKVTDNNGEASEVAT